ncbi:MAG: hypothetical protein ACLQKA_00360 [Bryobacteraceae bacterium]
MEQNRERYRKLPGRRRGFLFGSSVWLGPDHLLLVKSARFREEYKRFYFRDIQAIVTANAPRLHISTRFLLIAVLWLWALGTVGVMEREHPAGSSIEWIPWAVAAVLLVAWIYISAGWSCRCRIYTAVSSEPLPSLYRTWTARRFLKKVEPYLAQAQGVIEGDWAEAVEDKQIGPLPEGRVGLAMPNAAAPLPPPPPAAKTAFTPASVLFVASLCLGGSADLLALRASANVGRWILLGFLLLQVTAAVAVLVQNYLGKLVPSLRNLAIVALASIGIWYYAAQIGASFAIAYQNARSRHPSAFPAQMQPLGLLGNPVSRGIAGGIGVLLGLAGVVLLLRGERSPEEKVSFNV